MKDAKKSRPSGNDTRTAAETGRASRQAHDSTKNDTTPRSGGQTGISALLMCGAENAIPLRQLKQMTGLVGGVEPSDRRRKRQLKSDHAGN